MRLVILGGGLSGLSAAYFLQKKDKLSEIIVFEKEDRVGGLCRSFHVKGGMVYDIGPHIIFSKDQPVLDLMTQVLGQNHHLLRRSNRIIHKGIFVQYPFENDLSRLPKQDLDYCVNAFFDNPYENYPADNMLQFFLKIFGDGITNIFLRPYNEKIWKFDPSFMDTQMVERIPKPTEDEMRRSASGETVDGYLHQLYFAYPKQGGIEALVRGFMDRLGSKVSVYPSTAVSSVAKTKSGFEIETSNGVWLCDRLISTLPVDRFVKHIYAKPFEAVRLAAERLRYNSIIIAIVNVAVDRAGDNFAFMVADKDIIFHRLSKIDFLGQSIENTATYMVEITYRKGDLIDGYQDEELLERIIGGLIDIGFVKNRNEINFHELKRFEYAYVIYDLEHRKNMDIIVSYFKKEGVVLGGRFGSFEYLNMDAVIKQSMQLAAKF